MNSPRRRFECLQSGYTLVEILVVLAIIATLTALIFAAFGSARGKGREAACTSQLHQWGLAFAMYSQDYDGGVPVKGKLMKPSQVGLPPGSDILPFIHEYHLEKVVRCPSTHYPAGMPKNQMPLISYDVHGFADDNNSVIDFATQLSEYGTDYPLLYCEMHNADVDFTHQPTWAKKRVLVLRWDQHIQNEILPVHASPPNI